MIEATSRIEDGSVFRQATVSDDDAPHIKPRTQADGTRFFTGVSCGMQFLGRENVVKYVNFAEDGGPQTVNLTLDRGKAVELEFVDADGQPVSGVGVSGISDREGPGVIRVKESRTTVFALGSDRPRKVVVLHPERSLAGSVTLPVTRAAPVRLTLGKSASIRGRAIDESGDPITGAEFFFYSQRQFQQLLNSGRPEQATDKEGRFRIVNLVPGERFSLNLTLDKQFLNAKLTKEQQTLAPGQDLNLGDVIFVAQNRRLPPQTEAAAVPAAPPPLPIPPASAAQSRTIRGRVVDSKGNPIAGVPLLIPVIERRRAVLAQRQEALTKATTAADGSFVVELSDRDFLAGMPTLPLIALHPAHGVEWFDIPKDGEVSPVEIVLYPEQLVCGRMIDTEGRPVAGAKVTIASLGSPRSANSLDSYLDELIKRGGVRALRHLSYKVLPESYAATSDGEGRFVIHGVAAERVCEATVAADRFATARFTVVNRQGLDTSAYNERSRRPARSVAKLVVGPEFVHVGAPGLTIAGKATVDQGQPVAGLAVTGYGLPEHAVTDAEGRYRVTGLPRGLQIAVRFALGGHDDLLPHAETLPATPDDAEKTVNVEMKRGILVSGRVVDPLTGKGVLANVGYAPVQGNEHAKALGYNGSTGYTMHGVVDDDGKFQIAVIPGPGALLVDAYDAMIDLGGQQVSAFRRGHVAKEEEAKLKVSVQADGLRSFATHRGALPLSLINAVKYIDFAEDSGPQTADIELDRGKSIELNVVDADGQPVAGAAIVGILEWQLPTRVARSQTTVFSASMASLPARSWPCMDAAWPDR